MSRKRRRKPKSQRPSRQGREPRRSWCNTWDTWDPVGSKKANQGEPLRVVARNENLQAGEFLVRLVNGGTNRHHILRNAAEWIHFENTHFDSITGIEGFKQKYDSVQAVNHLGCHVKLMAVCNALRVVTKISVDDILRAWGVTNQWQEIRSRLHIQSPNHSQIDVLHPPRAQEFETLWQEWLDNGISDRIETLYHGTTSENVANIITNGFRMPRYHCQAFGAGIYLGPIPKAKGFARANTWCNSGSANPKALRFLIEADVLVGAPYVPSEIRGSKTRAEMKKAACQSVYYGGFQNPEWVVYNPAQIRIRRVIRIG